MLKDYKGDAAVASGEAFDPSPDNIDRRTQHVNLPGALKLAVVFVCDESPKVTLPGPAYNFH